MRAPALFRQVRAFVTGYYWLPCQNCGHWHAGYEDTGPGLMNGPGSGWVTCSRPECVEQCTEKMREWSRRYKEGTNATETDSDDAGLAG